MSSYALPLRPLCFRRPPDLNLNPKLTTSDDALETIPPPPSPPPQKTETAASQVLRLPELVEIILLQLSQKDLLLSQRTSATFWRTTSASPRLQQALFNAPDCKSLANVTRHQPGRKPENNRLLLRAFPGCYPTVTLVIKHDAEGHERWSWDVCISFPADRAPSINPAVLRPEASWRKMFLSQPPCTSLYLVRRWQRSVQPAIVREEGLRMGDFVDEATASRRWHSSYISSDRDWHFEGNIRSGKIEDV